MQDARHVEDDEARRREGVRALEEGRYEDARDIFADLLERDAEDEALAGLHDRADALASASIEGHQWRIGIASCDEYLEHYLRCIDMLPEAAREPTREAVAQTVEAWREVARGPGREMLHEACDTAREAAQRATAALGCEW
jgi:thioredoxin-like negative regulator of GroEL